jgi:hypothetical protein
MFWECADPTKRNSSAIADSKGKILVFAATTLTAKFTKLRVESIFWGLTAGADLYWQNILGSSM